MTEFITKSKEVGAKHGGKAVSGLSAAAVLWMYATFPSKTEFHMLRDNAAETHRQVQDIANILMSHHASTLTNEVSIAKVNP